MACAFQSCELIDLVILTIGSVSPLLNGTD